MDKRTLADTDEHDLARATAARLAFIRWRMGDVPTVYCALLPTTPHLKTLLLAERCIRQQIAEDQKLLASPWRKVGPDCAFFDQQDLTPDELIRIGCETTVAIGMPDAVKPGMEDHPE